VFPIFLIPTGFVLICVDIFVWLNCLFEAGDFEIEKSIGGVSKVLCGSGPFH